jgi:GTPase-associated adaptor domain/Calcineurin-like phosphoesterase
LNDNKSYLPRIKRGNALFTWLSGAKRQGERSDRRWNLRNEGNDVHSMILLNISDIHFRHPICNTTMDPDRPYRTRLIQDVRSRVARLGSVGAILVGGDIAFAGAPEEYDAAYTWLHELASASGCSLARVFVVPGNHDVDRKVVQSNVSVRNVQGAIARAQSDRRERELFQQFRDAEAGRALFAPIEAYNAFAARFSCQVYTPEKLFWHQDLPLDDGVILRLYGLTSTLLSGADGHDDVRQRLYLSPLQTVLDPLDGVVNAVMCHHPPDWFMDHDDVEDAVRGRAAIHFFGHKHRQRIYSDTGYIRFSAGAVNPDRNELGWEPGYNLIRLTTSEKHGSRFLDIEAHLLVWQTNPDMFRAKKASETDDVFRHRLRIQHVVSPARDLVVPALDTPSTSETPDPLKIIAVAEMETTMSDERTRNLVLRFWDLASSERREIALTLGLIEPDEMRLPEAERYGRALGRAGERGLLTRIAEEIEKRERR